ncbi:hypothetical protein K488DRAFT_54152 [Vararia minispora EC-137]|uniref:Uncharacterized protein n=1 Tax=Vararia minispora EC-137 TaxID=1314806 RepID=A0ACB8QFS2_9AGAM|nr:hypothetical protein K488DRAFT_54152 [Vararia minispora EC-137]
MGCATKNAKIVGISLGSLQRLISLRAVPLSAVPVIIATMNDCMSQGVDIQLKILQTLLSLITNFPTVHGQLLADALLVCFKLHESRIAVVSSTAAATLRQLVMFVVDKVVEEDRRETEDLEETTLPDGATRALGPSARDAFAVVQDLCLLANSEKPHFLELDFLHKTFALELIESVLTNYHELFRKHLELLLLLQHHLCPLLHKSLSDRPVFPLTLRSTRVIFLLLKQFSAELITEAEVFLTLLIKIIGGDDGGPHWMRVLALEIVRGLCTDADFVRAIWQRYDGQQQESGEGASASVFTMLVTVLKRNVTEKPSLLGISQQMLGVNVPQAEGAGVYGLDGVAGMVATAASATVSNVVGMIGSEAGLSSASAMKLQCIDQLDKADAPPIPDAYVYLLGVHCLVSLCEGFASYTAPIYTQLMVQKPRAAGDAVVRAPGALDPSTLPETEPARASLMAVRDMVAAGWPALLAALSFLLSTNLSDELFVDVLAAYQALTNVAGMLALPTPRDALLSGLAKVAIPARVVSALESYIEPNTPRTASSFSENLGLVPAQLAQPGLSERNLACLKVLVGSTLFLAGSLGESWFSVLEALQNADYVLTSKGAKLAGQSMKRSTSLNASQSHRSVSQSGNTVPSSGPRHPLLTDLEPDNLQLAIQRLFDSTKSLEDAAFKDFVNALCKLSAAMVDMMSMSDLGTSASTSGEFDPIPEDSVTVSGSRTSLDTAASGGLTARPAHASRRRVSGIHLPRGLRTGDFGISKLGGVAIMNIHRLIYRSPDIAWNTVTSHLLFVIRNQGSPQMIRIQAATTLDEILVAAPRNLGAAHDVREAVQRRVLDALSQQVMLDQQATSSANVDLRKMGLETLHEILQASGHTLVVGWETIFEMLSSVCRPALPATLSSSSDVISPATSPGGAGRSKPPPLGYMQERGYTSLIKIAFQSLTLVCDSLSALSPSHLRLCIATLGAFGRQADTNIALTAAESLFWGVSDSIQAKRKDAEQEPEYSSLWMFLLLEILGLCTDARPEVRTGAIQTLFRTLQLYGATLSGETWDECLWRVTFPLLDALTAAVRAAAEGEESKKWAESKVVALQAVGGIFADFLQTKLMGLSSFDRAWNAFVLHVRDAFLLDEPAVGAPALRCLERALRAVEEAAKDSELHEQARGAWEAAWAACDEMGGPVVKRNNQSPFSQEELVELVGVVRATRAASRALDGAEWPLERLERLMGILKGVLTYPLSTDYRPDVDVLTPVQAAVMDCVESVDLTVPGAPSLVLSDLSEFATLAFLAAFDVRASPPANKGAPRKRVTYVALAKWTMPLLVELFLRFKDASEVYASGTLEAILAAYAIPIKLKYECPAPSKFADGAKAAMPLWKTATTCFLRVAGEVAGAVQRFSSELPDSRVEGIWRQTIDVFRGGILADCSAAETLPLDVQESEESFDLSLVAALEIDVVPHLGDARVPDALVLQLARVLQQGSQVRRADDGDGAYASPPHTPTREGGERAYVLRERFAYWCFDLLFLVCSNTAKDNEAARRRVAALCLPSLLGRCQTTLVGFIADEAVRGSLPFPRAREEELLYVLQKLLDLRLWNGSLAAAISDTPSDLANALPPLDTSLPPAALLAATHRRSARAHLFHFYSVLCEIAALPRAPPVAFVRAGPLAKAGNEGKAEGGERDGRSKAERVLGIGAQEAVVERDARKLARECLREVGRELGVPR